MKPLAILLLLATTTTVSAQSADKKKTAKQYVDAGLAAEGTGDYDTAITMYQKAYALIPAPVLLFDVANAEREGGHLDQALDDYKQYVAAAPKGDKVAAANQHISEIETQQAADAKAKADADAAAAAKAKADADAAAAAKAKADADAAAAARAKADADAAAAAKAKTEVHASVPPPHDGWSGMRIAGVVSGGLGAAGLAAGVYFGLHAKSISDELSKPGAIYDPAKVSDGEAANRNMWIGYGAGTALVAAGAVLYFLGADHHVAPMADANGGGLAVSGRF